MPSPLEIFDRISIINLPYRVDRRREIEQQLARFGLSLDRDPVRLFPAVRPTDPGGFPNIGARGCFLSHLGVLQQAQAERVRRLLILEDDFDFADGLTEQRLAQVLDELSSQPWALFYGGHRLTPAPELLRHTALSPLAPSTPVVTSHCLGMKDSAIAIAVPYLEAILNRPAGHVDGGPMHVDGAYSRLRADHPELTTYSAWPPVGHQRSSRTDIHALRWYDRWPATSFAIEHFRALRRRFLRSGFTSTGEACSQRSSERE